MKGAYCALMMGAGLTASAAVEIGFPTENRALLESRHDDFFQPTISGRRVSGTFGFVRTSGPEPPKYLERFHEGIDIKPVRRDGAGEPLDPVVAMAAGKVVYINAVEAKSSYGLYVLVRHEFDGWPMFGFYSHLASISVSEGARVESGQELGILGYTGPGVNQARAHLHLELTFQLQEGFGEWFRKAGKPEFGERGENHHGDYSGLAFLGVDPVPLLKASAAGKPLTVPEIFERERVQFKVDVPSGKDYWFWQKQFPFQVEGGIEKSLPPAWRISCNRIGIPLRFERLDKAVPEAQLVYFRPNLSVQDWFTRGLVEGRGKERLSKWGRKWLSQLTWEG